MVRTRAGMTTTLARRQYHQCGVAVSVLTVTTPSPLPSIAPAAEPLKFLPFDLIKGEKQIVGSMIGGTVVMKEMLQFSADHKCFPQCEVINFEQAQEGIAKVLANSARYRMVLKIEGFRAKQTTA